MAQARHATSTAYRRCKRPQTTERHELTGAADRIAPPGGTQDTRAAIWLGGALLAAWSALALSGGGIDLGNLPGGNGPLVQAIALLLLPAGAVAALTLRSRPWTLDAQLAVIGSAGFAIWSAMSIRWATAPDLAWLATNRAVVACAALLAGIGLGRALTRAPQRFVVGLALAIAPVLAWALASRVVPEVLAPVVDRARLANPLHYANALALLAVFAIPGAASLLARGGRSTTAGASLLAAALATLALTQSRSGVLVAVLTLTAILWTQPGRAITLATSITAVVALAPAIAYAAIAPGLHADQVLPPGDQRRAASLVLGALLAIGIAATVLIAPLLVAPLRRIDRRLGRTGRRVAATLVLGASGAAIGVLALGDRFANTAGIGRLVSLDSNNRSAWWSEAWRGFTSSPLIGHGAGSFPYTHVQERAQAVDQNRVRQPHQLLLEALTEVGTIGALLALVGVVGAFLALRRVGRRGVPAAAILGAFLVQAQFDWTWSIPATALPAMAAAGVLVGTPTHGAPSPPPAWSRRALRLVPLAIAVAISGALPYWATNRARLAEQARTAGNEARALQLAAQARDANPLAIHGNLIAADVHYGANDANAAVAAALAATRRQPESPIAWECLVLTGNNVTSQAAIAKVRTLNPASALALHAPQCRGSW